MGDVQRIAGQFEVGPHPGEAKPNNRVEPVQNLPRREQPVEATSRRLTWASSWRNSAVLANKNGASALAATKKSGSSRRIVPGFSRMSVSADAKGFGNPSDCGTLQTT